ncbi:MAG TPA: hypothetical protein VI589_10740 [Vicinamibacteria bacterium]|jgi:hypothetical protein
MDPAAKRLATLEAARLLGRYRKLILLGRLRLPLEAARRLVGPDCAYHLYGRTVSARRGRGRAGRR